MFLSKPCFLSLKGKTSKQTTATEACSIFDVYNISARSYSFSRKEGFQPENGQYVSQNWQSGS